MGVPNFPEKFKIIERALERAGKKLLHKWIAAAVFPGAKKESAESMWSNCRNGRRNLADDKLGPLVSIINEETGGLLKDIPPHVFIKSTRHVEQTFANADLIDAPLPEPKPLSEMLANIRSANDVLTLLRSYPHTYETSNEFDVSFHLLSENTRRRVASLFCQAVEESLETRGRLRSGMVAGATLARIWPSLARLPEINRLSDWLETRIGELTCRFVPVADAVCYIGALHGRQGAFTKNIERVIEDPHWRRIDLYEQLRYHHGYETLARHIAVHLRYRMAHPQILCNDVGRVISIYPELIKHREFADLAAVLKEETIKSLAYADIKRSLRGRVEDIMEQRDN